ncbi:hypothetical protein ACFRFH_11940 [Leifsonia sp. NPDC056824]|uniref:hypothetical protein n=1 Tax=Leifsonia sp. NPDC056824 TaxID=3345953 RepID=UPI0036860E98
MGHRERKARKRAGIKFSKPAKVGTPLELRAINTVTKKVDEVLMTVPSGRGKKRIKRHQDVIAGFTRWG